MLLFNEYQSKESLANLKRLYAMAKNCPFCGEKPIFNSVRRNRTSNEFVVPFDFYYLWAGREHTQKDKVLIYCENQEYEPAYTNRYIIQVKRGKE